MKKTVWVIFFFISLLFGGISEKYELYRKFLENRSIELAKKLIEDYPTAPFRNEVILFLLQKVYKTDKEEALRLIRKLDISNIPYSQVKNLFEIYKYLGLNPKTLIINYPEIFIEHLDKFKFSQDEREKIAKRLFKNKKYKYVLKLSKDCHLIGVSLYRLKEYGKSEKVLLHCQEDKAKQFLIYAYLKLNKYSQAEKFVEKENNPYLFYILGRELLERGFISKGIEVLEKSTYSESNFYLGIAYFALKDYKKAREYLKAYSPENDTDKAKRLFWLFKTELNLGNRDIALRYLRETSRYDNFYGAVAKLFLGLKVYKPITLVDVHSPNLYFELKKIYDLGFLNYMRYEAFKNKEKITTGDILLLQDIDPYTSIRLSVNKYGVSSDIYRYVSHPTPFEEIVNRVSKRFKVPKALIYAVMRQESLFDIYAVSASGAKGLMQLMDFTAKWKAKRLGIKLDNIFEPYTNILLGTAYLAFLYDYWNGDMVRVIASYNAGQSAVSQWKRYDDGFLFIELIPYSETKNYTKKVLYNYYIYSEKLEKLF